MLVQLLSPSPQASTSAASTDGSVGTVSCVVVSIPNTYTGGLTAVVINTIHVQKVTLTLPEGPARSESGSRPGPRLGVQIYAAPQLRHHPRVAFGHHPRSSPDPSTINANWESCFPSNLWVIALLMGNIFIVGINNYDAEDIDKLNKPFCPSRW
jgi:hypothetical protein